jgi:hypothetical protein
VETTLAHGLFACLFSLQAPKQKVPIQRYDAHALSMLFSVVQNWPLANIGFLAHRVTTSKTLAQTNKQALM